MRDVLGERVLGANGGDADVGGLAGLGEGVVAAVEVFALLLGEAAVSMYRNFRMAGRDRRGNEACGWAGRTLNLFCSRSLVLGTLPYMRKIFCSSSDIF